MLLDRHRPHVFRERRFAPDDAEAVAAAEVRRVRERASAYRGLISYAVHRAQDRTSVVTVEAWTDKDAVRSIRAGAEDAGTSEGVYAWVGTGGREPTPVDDSDAGAIVIDLFSVWRPLVRPVSAFNVRNGRAFNEQPGCISTSVFRDTATGRIATYARWRTVEDFTAAFAKVTGRPAATPQDVNRAAARMTFGMIRPDYRAHDLIAFSGDAR